MKVILAVLGAVAVVLLALAGLLWWLVPIAFPGTVVGFWQALALAVLVVVFGGGVFFAANLD